MNEMYIFHLEKLIFKMVGKVNFCLAAEQYIPSGYTSEPFHGQLLCNKSFHTLGFACISKSCILVDGISSFHMIRHQQQSSLLVTICHVCCKQMISLKTKQKTVNYLINLLQTTHQHYDNTAACPQASSTQIFWLPVVSWVSCCYLGDYNLDLCLSGGLLASMFSSVIIT